MQVAIYIYSKPGPRDLSAFPALKMLETFIEKMKKEAASKNQNTILFDDPDAVSIGDPDLLIALNKKLEQDPEYPVPEGFTKRKEKTIVYNYGAPVYLGLSEAHNMAFDILDELLFSKFGFHFLEPICTFEEKTKIRPVIHKRFDETNGGSETPSYLQSLDKRSKPKELNDKAKMDAYDRMRTMNDRAPRLPTELKVEVAKFPQA